MPTLLSWNGYRFFFYSLEGRGKSHVHVYKAGAEAKIWLEPLELAKNAGFSTTELRTVIRHIDTHKGMLLDKWYEHFGY